ncbi:hypothetical protein C8R44DRAFT_895425 [Mycena epipterygia]|nr:hypothetical protein C8R44DRAFT_895425 [Mycena epipterygia]
MLAAPPSFAEHILLSYASQRALSYSRPRHSPHPARGAPCGRVPCGVDHDLRIAAPLSRLAHTPLSVFYRPTDPGCGVVVASVPASASRRRDAKGDVLSYTGREAPQHEHCGAAHEGAPRNPSAASLLGGSAAHAGQSHTLRWKWAVVSWLAFHFVFHCYCVYLPADYINTSSIPPCTTRVILGCSWLLLVGLELFVVVGINLFARRSPPAPNPSLPVLTVHGNAVSFSAGSPFHLAAMHQAGTFQLEVQGPPLRAAGFETTGRELSLLHASRARHTFLFTISFHSSILISLLSYRTSYMYLLCVPYTMCTSTS